MRLAPSLLGLPILLHAQIARSEDRAAVWDRPFVVGAQLDLLPMTLPLPGSALLVVVEAAPVRWASLELGGGVTVLQHPAALAMVHLQAPLGRWAPGLEAGFLTGPTSWDPDATTNGIVSFSDLVDRGYKLHLDAAVSGRLGATLGYRSPGGFQLRIHAGATAILNRRAAYCVGEGWGGCNGDSLPGALPYLGVTLGYAFGR